MPLIIGCRGCQKKVELRGTGTGLECTFKDWSLCEECKETPKETPKETKPRKKA